MNIPSLHWRLVFAMAGHSRTGLRLKDIAAAAGASAPATLRALQRMAEDGVAEKVPQIEHHWRLTPRLVQVALLHADEVEREDRIGNEFKHRFSRLPV